MIGKSNMRTFGAIVAPTLAEGDFTNVQEALDSLGAGASIFVKNGTYGDFNYTADRQQVHGESWDVIIDGDNVTAINFLTFDQCRVTNLQTKTTPGGGNSAQVIVGTGAILMRIDHVYVSGSDTDGIGPGGGANATVEDCLIDNIDDRGIVFNGLRATANNNIFGDTIGGVASIQLAGSADNSIITANTMHDTGVCILVDAAAENCLVAANITNGVITDNSGTSTVTANHQY